MTAVRALRGGLASVLDAHVDHQRRDVMLAIDRGVEMGHATPYQEFHALQLAWADLVESVAAVVRP